MKSGSVKVKQANLKIFPHWNVGDLKRLFPAGIPLVYKSGDGKWHGRSPYHTMPVMGYIPAANGEILCDAVPLAYRINGDGEGLWFDPTRLAADIWGNLWVFDSEGNQIGYIRYDDDLVVIVCASCKRKAQEYEGHRYCSSCYKQRVAA